MGPGSWLAEGRHGGRKSDTVHPFPGGDVPTRPRFPLEDESSASFAVDWHLTEHREQPTLDVMRWLALLLGHLIGCTPGLPSQDLPSAGEGGALHGAILLPLTVRSTAGLLGHVWSPATRRVDTMRRAVDGPTEKDVTRQHVEVLMSIDLVANLGVQQQGVGASVSGQHRTDVAYSVDITGYETLAARPSGYRSDSACCVNGVVTSTCEWGYVGRVLRGSGKLRYLRRLQGNASANLGPVLQAGGGARYELLDETTFEDAFFAFVPEPLDALCERLEPGQEMVTLKVPPPDNCRCRVYRADTAGSKSALTGYYPSAEACFSAAASICQSETGKVVACPATFHASDGSVTSRDFATGNGAISPTTGAPAAAPVSPPLAPEPAVAPAAAPPAPAAPR
jgi:hypothetical protein